MTNEMKSGGNSRELIELEEEKRTHKKSAQQKPVFIPGERKGSLFVEKKGGNLENYQKEQRSKKNTLHNSGESKTLKESIQSAKKEVKLTKLHVCVPQTPFSQVTIDYLTEGEKNSTKFQREVPFEAGANYNYSLKPRMRIEENNEVERSPDFKKSKERDPIFDCVGFALNNTSSLRAQNNCLFEVQKGEPVCLRSCLDDPNLVECKLRERIGIFKKRDFYYWQNKIPTRNIDENVVISPTFKNKPLKPNIFTLSHR